MLSYRRGTVNDFYCGEGVKPVYSKKKKKVRYIWFCMIKMSTILYQIAFVV